MRAVLEYESYRKHISACVGIFENSNIREGIHPYTRPLQDAISVILVDSLSKDGPLHEERVQIFLWG